MNGDLTLDELYALSNELCRKHWGVNFTGQIELVNRNWKRRQGCYVPDENLIRMSRKTNAKKTRAIVLDTLLHELVHWRLHTTGQPYDDADFEFIAECLRVGASISGATYAQKAFDKYMAEESDSL